MKNINCSALANPLSVPGRGLMKYTSISSLKFQIFEILCPKWILKARGSKKTWFWKLSWESQETRTVLQLRIHLSSPAVSWLWPIVYPSLSYLVREGTWRFEFLQGSSSFNKRRQLHGKTSATAESWCLTSFALVLASAADMGNTLANREVCECEFAHQGNIYSVHSWL